MINQEEWLTNGIKSELYVVKLKNYDRNKVYELPIKPSPNLPNKSSVNLYPSLCLFEGTNISALIFVPSNKQRDGYRFTDDLLGKFGDGLIGSS